MSTKNIVLTGFMGTGKSTVGRELAERLGRRFVDTDVVIEQRHGPIPLIFEDRGEAAFREFERTVADELGRQSNLVIATGGGLFMDPNNVESLAREGRIFCLTAPSDEIIRRIRSDTSAANRPLLDTDDPSAKAAILLAERQHIYSQFEQIETYMRLSGQVVDDIERRLTIEDPPQNCRPNGRSA